MTDLRKQLNDIQADSIPAIEPFKKSFSMFVDQHGSLFERACKRKPDVEPTQHLLGLLTKAHIEEASAVESFSEASAAMHELISDKLGNQNAGKFEEQGSNQLILVTHLWLYVQGYFRMDFSLANDHAMNSAELIAASTLKPAQELRTQFLESFYLGMERSPITVKRPSRILLWLKQLFG
ncbi:hypothetical protein [Vibrio sp. TBV020]|uniref:hypothetical protein n=1 Tax=Vibrio sp. TBV020 TaxID=3137398 RepID=UPI0038CDBC8C